MTLLYADEQVELSRESAVAVNELLSSGRLPGSDGCAARLAEALSRPAGRLRHVVDFEPYEWRAIGSALAALDLVRYGR